MRIYITDLEAYNRGHLVGEWLDFPMSENEVSESIKDVLFEGKRLVMITTCMKKFL